MSSKLRFGGIDFARREPRETKGANDSCSGLVSLALPRMLSARSACYYTVNPRSEAITLTDGGVTPCRYSLSPESRNAIDLIDIEGF